MKESAGVLIAVLSSALGGGAAVATRFLVDSVDPVTIAAVRFAVDAAGDDHDCRRPAIGVLQAASRWRSLRASAPRPKAPGATT